MFANPGNFRTDVSSQENLFVAGNNNPILGYGGAWKAPASMYEAGNTQHRLGAPSYGSEAEQNSLRACRSHESLLSYSAATTMFDLRTCIVWRRELV